jgi:hypothetical protein
MAVIPLPLRRTTPLASAEACAVRCALFAQIVPDRETRLALLSAAGKYARRGLQLVSLGVRQ